jgi:RNA polymerase sigma factor (sigma-70 family)
MKTYGNSQLVRWLRHLRSGLDSSDGVLLRRFAGGDEAAFVALVKRYGGLVWGVGRRALNDEHDAEDVFQATFLTLARKARLLEGERSLANWLYTVAVRLAGKARAGKKRQPGPLWQLEPAVRDDPLTAMTGRELCRAFDDELQLLPDKLRAAIVLCCLEGRTRDEAAMELDCTVAAVKSRLERGRERLRQALSRRGVHLPAAFLAAGLGNTFAPDAVRAAALTAVRGSASPGALALAQATPALFVAKVALGLMATSLAGVLFGLAPRWSAQSAPLASSPPPPQTATPASNPAKPGMDRFGDALPEGALARYGTVRLRQGFLVQRVLFAPDGKKLALAGCGRPVGLWDVKTGKELQQFRKNNNQPSGIAFSHDGALIAEGDNEVRVWSTRTGALVREMPNVGASQRAVVFSPDDRLLISGGHDSLIHLWDVTRGTAVGKLEGHADSVLALALTHDGRTLASAGSDKSIRLWDLNRRVLLRELKGHEGYLSCLSFSPDGRLLASGGESQAQCRVWDVATGTERFRLGNESRHLYAFSFSPDGKLIATGHVDGAVILWDAATGKNIRKWSSPFLVRSLDFAPDGKTLATVSGWECGPRLWDVRSGSEIRPTKGHSGLIEQMRLLSGGKTLLSLGREHQLLRWDIESSSYQVLRRLPVGPWNHYANELSPDGLVLAMASAPDKTVKLVDSETQKDLTSLICDVDPRYLRFSPDGNALAIGCSSGTFYLWNWRERTRPRKVTTAEKDSVTVLHFAPDGKWLVTGSENPQNPRVHIWDMATAKLLLSVPGNQRYSAAAISPDGKWAAVAFYDRTLRIFPIPQRKEDWLPQLAQLKEQRLIPLQHSAIALAFSSDGQVLAAGEEERAGAVHLLDFASDQHLLSLNGHHSGVITMIFSPDGRSLFSGGGDSTILRWDATGRRGKTPAGLNLTAAWEALAGDVRSAYRAQWDLLDAPADFIALLRERLPRAKSPNAEHFRKLVDALDSKSFRERSQATADIKALGASAEVLLRKHIGTEKRLEVRRRLQAVHENLLKSRSWQRARRALTIVAAVPSVIAQPYVQDLANGDVGAVLTQEAKALLKR